LEYKKLLIKNETINSFVLGEPSTITTTEFCNHKRENTGIASDKEFPHIALIKLDDGVPKTYHQEVKCVGTLISDRHVMTSYFCVNSLIKHKVFVYLGTFNYNLSGEGVRSFEVESAESIYGVTILKLKNQVSFDERIMPACLFTGKSTASDILLTGWTGDWRECDPRLKKWLVRNSLVVNVNRWQMTIDQSSILNYREVGSD
jgi:hypothetical protein